MVRFLTIVLLFGAMGLGGLRAGTDLRPVGSPAFARHVAEGRDSPFGVDYVFVLDPAYRKPDLAAQLGGLVGVRWVNFARVNWGDLEPRAPVKGKHTYRWAALDEGVRQWQRQGVHIAMSLRFVSSWAKAKGTIDPLYLKGLLSWIPRATADFLPKPGFEQDLRDFVRALVERYDGDGVDDMPGLLFPVLHYQVCNEAYNEVFWAGSAEEYGALLAEVAGAARAACPDVKIVLAGVCFLPMDGFYDRAMDPRTRAYVDRLLPRTAPRMLPFLSRADRFSRRTLSFPDYDILDARWSFFGVVDRCREELRKAGRDGTQIWSAEIYTAHPLLDALVLPMTTLYPYPTPSRSLEYIDITRSPRHRLYPVVNRWYRARQAAMVVKCCLVGLHAGTRKLMAGWALDSQTRATPYPLGVGGYRSATTGTLWPAAYTYKVLIEKLDGITACRRLPTGEFVYAYECTVRGGRKVIVAFLDDHVARDHDQAGPTATATLPVAARRARVTHIVSEIDRTDPVVEELDVTDGSCRLTLTDLPVFLEPVLPRE